MKRASFFTQFAAVVSVTAELKVAISTKLNFNLEGVTVEREGSSIKISGPIGVLTSL